VVFGVVVAVLGLVEITFLTGDGGPHVFRSGQELLGQMLQLGQPHFLAWTTLLTLAVLKAVATALTHASGGSSGAFMPTLFIGGALGAALGQLAGEFWDVAFISRGALAVVGMASMFAAVARAPLTAIIIVFEMTGAQDYGLVLPLMLAASIATFLSERFEPLSFYGRTLDRMGIHLARTGEVDLLDTVSVGEVSSRALTVKEWTSIGDAGRILDRHRSHGAAVVDRAQRLTGIVTITDLARGGSPADAVTTVMTPRPSTITPSMPVSAALERMAVLGVGRIPVVDDADPSRLIGMFRREDAVQAYHQALGASTGQELQREQLRQRTDPGAHYYEFRIPQRSIADGKALRDVAWPEGSTLVSVRRGTEVLVPSGTTILRADDVITAFGTPGSQRRVIERLDASSDDATAEITGTIPIVAPAEPETGDDAPGDA
jgi:CIC family chloride channel protein